MLDSEKPAKTLFELIDGFKGRVKLEVLKETVPLIGEEPIGVAANQRQQASIHSALRIQERPSGQKLLVDQADDVEPVSDDQGLGEVFASQGSIGGRQIHAYDLDLLFAQEAVHIPL